MKKAVFFLRFLLSSSFLALSLLLPAQAKLIFQIDIEIKFAITDKLQQTYIVTPDDVLIKYDARGKEMGRYTNNYLGDLEMVDPTNPINVVLYYPDLQTLVTLDVTMNEIARTNLVSFGFFNIEALSSSNDGHIWILDGMEFKLKKIDRNGRILSRSENLMILTGEPFQPIQILERNNRVFALDPEKGIYTFDNLGNFDRRYAIKGVSYMQMLGDRIYFLDQGVPSYWDTQLYMDGALKLPGEGEDKLLFFNIQVDRCFLFTANGFQVWRI